MTTDTLESALSEFRPSGFLNVTKIRENTIAWALKELPKNCQGGWISNDIIRQIKPVCKGKMQLFPVLSLKPNPSLVPPRREPLHFNRSVWHAWNKQSSCLSTWTREMPKEAMWKQKLIVKKKNFFCLLWKLNKMFSTKECLQGYKKNFLKNIFQLLRENQLLLPLWGKKYQ